MKYCFQCGIERRPVRATHVDQDGEPACIAHAADKNSPAVEEEKEKRVEKHLCKCGCGNQVTGRDYVWGHKGTSPKAAREVSDKVKDHAVAAADFAVLELTEAAANKLFSLLPLAAKQKAIIEYLKSCDE